LPFLGIHRAIADSRDRAARASKMPVQPGHFERLIETRTGFSMVDASGHCPVSTIMTSLTMDLTLWTAPSTQSSSFLTIMHREMPILAGQ